jgi:multisubunit Na+/H+ antiporter MnhF subunit
MLGASLLLCVYRLVKGPTAFDRALALDVISFVAIAAIAVFSMQMYSLDYFPALLVLAILGFFGLVAVGRFLFRGDVIDRHG